MIELSHIGENLIAAMLSRSVSARASIVGAAADDEWLFVPEAALNPVDQFLFDGAHRVDVCALNRSQGYCIAMEAKLGRDRLAAREFNRRFLGGCGTSHQAKRIKGSMISVLDGKLPSGIDRSKLTVTFDAQPYRVERDWILILREPVLNRWKDTESPQLTGHCAVHAIESLVRSYGRPEDFNQLVSELISQDFYGSWFEGE